MPAPVHGLRVLTLNLLSPDHASWERRRPVLGGGLRTLRPDLVAFQETVWGDGGRAHVRRPEPLVRAGEMSLERGRRIDDVMVRSGVHGPTLDVTGCRLAFDEPVDGVWASDHFGVVADLALPTSTVGSWDEGAP